MSLTHRQYEHLVATTLRGDGWHAEVTPPVRDFGVDVIAERDRHRLAVQVKKYRDAGRAVNPATVMEAYGAAAYAGCEQCMVVTDGRILPTAIQVAEKLDVELRHVPAAITDSSAFPPGEFDFDHIWSTYIAPLAGRKLERPNGSRNEIVRVGPAGIVRRTSSGKTQQIGIDIFRWTVERLLAGRIVTREEINDHYIGRASSGIFLILSHVPIFEVVTHDRKQALIYRDGDPPSAADAG